MSFLVFPFVFLYHAITHRPSQILLQDRLLAKVRSAGGSRRAVFYYGLAGLLALALLLALAVVGCWCRWSRKGKVQRRVNEQMDRLEARVAKECKEGEWMRSARRVSG